MLHLFEYCCFSFAIEVVQKGIVVVLDKLFHVTILCQMQQLIHYAVIYSYDRTSRLRKDGTASVLVRAYQGGSYSYFKTGVFIEPQQWCQRTLRVKNHPRQALFNSTILRTQRELEAFEAETIKYQGACSLEQLKGYQKEQPKGSFVAFFRQEMEQERPRVKPSTYETYVQTLAKLEDYQPNMSFTQLEPGNIRRFLQHLTAQGLHPNSVKKHYKNFKKFVRIALQHGYLKDHRNPCDEVKWKGTKTERLYLTEEEIVLLENYQAPADKPLWKLAQQLFLFCCYTGLRYSDASELTEDNIQETQDKVDLHFRAQKTEKPYRVDINIMFGVPGEKYSKPVQIIQDRLNADDHWLGDRLFPFNHRNSYVRILKQIMQTLPVRKGLQQGVSSHTGRHSFAVLMARHVRVEILQQLMQHASIKETMIYMHLSEKQVHEALEKVKW